MNNKNKLLIIEDETNIRTFVKTILETHDYQVLEAANGKNGKMICLSHNPDLVILDLGLPDMDGLQFIHEIRQVSSVPVIVLSARTNETDKVEALDAGANDYITKPFGTEELLARVRATLRTNRQLINGNIPIKDNFCCKNLVINYKARQIKIDNIEVKLTHTEYNIVELLSLHADTVLTYTDIINRIWQYSDSGSVKKLQVNMANIRKKLGEKPGENKYIANELGVGYRMQNESEE